MNALCQSGTKLRGVFLWNWLQTGLALLLVLTGTSNLGAEPPRWNVLFLFADDMRADSIAALGNPVVKTPHLDSLVQRGRVFTNVYCLGGNSPAVCTPSRNMLLSGKAYFRWKDFRPPKGQRGLLAPGEGMNFPVSLKQAGYLTYHHGKKQNTAPLIESCFEINKYLKDDQAERLSGEPGQEIVDDAIRFLHERPQDRPFFMYLAFANPHDPRVAAPAYYRQYQRAQIPLMKNYRPLHPFDNGEMSIRDERLSPWPRTEDEIRRTLHEYYATITGLDYHIGRLLRALEELQLTDRTLVIFSADQGIAVGSHGLLGKQNLYEAAMKCPLVMAGPGIVPGKSAALVYLFDIYPTVCDLVGAEYPADLDGRSFQAVLKGEQASFRDGIFLSYRDVQRAYRDARWKIIRYPQVDVTQLFDLQEDPDELHDLASDPAHQTRIADMLKRLSEWQQHFGDEQPLTVPHPKPAAWTPPPQ